MVGIVVGIVVGARDVASVAVVGAMVIAVAAVVGRVAVGDTVCVMYDLVVADAAVFACELVSNAVDALVVIGSGVLVAAALLVVPWVVV